MHGVFSLTWSISLFDSAFNLYRLVLKPRQSLIKSHQNHFLTYRYFIYIAENIKYSYLSKLWVVDVVPLCGLVYINETDVSTVVSSCIICSIVDSTVFLISGLVYKIGGVNVKRSTYFICMYLCWISHFLTSPQISHIFITMLN